jgi:hypothetical protein
MILTTQLPKIHVNVMLPTIGNYKMQQQMPNKKGEAISVTGHGGP